MSDKDDIRKISRRQFLKTAGAGITAAGLGSLGGSLVAKEVLKDGNLLDEKNIVTGMQTGTSSADYYVSPDGSDSNDGTSSNPLASIHEAVSLVSEGETILVRGGEYQHEHGNPVIIDGKSGSESNPIRITSPPGERPHFKWEGGYTDWDIQGGFEFANGASHWIVEGIEVSQCPSLAISSSDSSDNLTFRDIRVHDNSNSGFQLRGTNQRIINTVAYDNYDEPNGGEDADGLVMSGVENGLIENCVCYGNADDGIDLWESSNITVRNTICRENGLDSNGDRNGIKSANTSSGGGNTFIRCIAYGNGKHGIRTYSPNGDTVINCTSYNNGSHGYAAIEGGDHEILNCIEYENESDYSFHDGVSDESNSWNQGIDDPQFQSTDSQSDNFLKLSDGSPAIDAGIQTGQVEYSRSSPDLGAHENGMNTPIGITETTSGGNTNGGDNTNTGDNKQGGQESGCSAFGLNSGFADTAWAENSDLQVVKVTNLNPDGQGSLQWAVNQSGPTLVVFEVGGVIDLQGSDLDMTEPQTYVAGQTAPSPGITMIKGGLRPEADDIVAQHIRVRIGDQAEDNLGDASSVGGNNVIFDHITATWGFDENMSVNNGGGQKVTLSNNIIAECLDFSGHSKATLIHDNTTEVALLGNLWAHSIDRHPLLKEGVECAIVNNYCYNYGTAMVRMSGDEGTPAVASLVGNIYKSGPASEDDGIIQGDPGTEAYVEDTIHLPNERRTTEGATTLIDSKPVWPEGLTAVPSGDVLNHHVNNVGARPADRTPHDERIIRYVQEGRGKILDSQDEVGGYPELEQTQRALNPPQNQDELMNWLNQYTRQVEGQNCTVDTGGTGTGATGGSSGSNGNTDGTTGGNTGAQPTNTIGLEGGDAGDTRQYVIYTNGRITKEDEHSGDSPHDRVFTSKVVGKTAGGHDGYVIHGHITEFYAEEGITITYNGQKMTPEEFKQTNICNP